jgi:hypothetical protein
MGDRVWGRKLALCRVLRHSLDHSTISAGANRGKLHSTGISFPIVEKCHAKTPVRLSPQYAKLPSSI